MKYSKLIQTPYRFFRFEVIIIIMQKDIDLLQKQLENNLMQIIISRLIECNEKQF